ncbi:MAG: hypothetical protein LC637_08085 [Xanthomonadaceae bacterium]|nr:hypothetical protein [Xanthomonadaceae bacterium]
MWVKKTSRSSGQLPGILAHAFRQLVPTGCLYLLQQAAVADFNLKNARNFALQPNEQMCRALGVGSSPVKAAVGRQSQGPHKRRIA